jgi:PBP1b-binding outer membrane lipoprotein LpoB
MTTIMRISLVALSVVLWVGCSEPAAPVVPDEPVVAAPEPSVLPPPAPVKAPEPAVAMTEIQKAAGLYEVLNDAALPDAQKQEKAAAQMAANGWTQETYQALLYDIAQDPLSRAAYVGLTQPQ